MPFFAENIGRWWGNNPVLKKQEEIDLIATDDENAVICECKYTENPFDEKQLNNLKDSALCVRQPNKTFVIFSRNGISSGAKEIIKGDSSYTVIGIKELFEE